jgi:hypothetical protein
MPSSGSKASLGSNLCLVALTLASALNAVGQDRLLTNATTINSTANPGSVSCAEYAADGVTCIVGQYYHSDGAQWNTSNAPIATWQPTYIDPAFGNWASGAANTSNPCIGCHHDPPIPNTNYEGANYLIGGHRNILRKVAPNQPWGNTQGQVTLTDASNNSIDWVNGNINLMTGSVQLYYIYGWMDAPDSAYKGGTYTCARCHTTGYRFDNAGPEPTLYDAKTRISDSMLLRTPAGGACTTVDPSTNLPYSSYATCTANGGTWPTASWNLTSIQCERCHKTDVQADASIYNPTIVFGNKSTSGRISHLIQLSPGSKVPPSFTLADCGIPGCQPLPKVPVNEQSTALCIECHRQEVSIPPTTAGGSGCPVGQTCKPGAYNLGQVHPAQLPGQTLPGMTVSLGAFKSGGTCSNGETYTGSVSAQYLACIAAGGTFGPYKPSMSHGANGAQTFLNSPHARFIGTLDQTAQNSSDLSVTLNGTYNSSFTDWGEAPGSRTGSTGDLYPGTGGPSGDATKNGGCASCHDVHNTLINVNATNVSPALVKQCTDCHSEHAQAVSHPTGVNTPFPNGFGDSETCKVCHMAGASGVATYHYFRINPAVNYYTFPSASQYYSSGGGNQQTNTFVETWYPRSGPATSYNASALDIDIACGQCHLGGNGANPYGIAPPTSGIPVYSRAFLADKASNMHNTQAPAPTFGPAYPYIGPLTTVVITGIPGSSIFYTLDGSIPLVSINSSQQYVSAAGGTIRCAGNPCSLPMTSSETIYAVAAGAASNQYKPSAVAGGTFSVPQVPRPVISPSGGNYTYSSTSSPTFTISDSQSGTTIYYTTDGSTPTAPPTGTTQTYSGPVTVTTSTVKAIAVETGNTNSAVAGPVTFTMKLAVPVFSNVGANWPGTYTGSATVLFTDTLGTASFCYTINGTTPTGTTAGTCTNGTLIGAGKAFTVTTTTAVKAIAVATNYTPSTLVSGNYTIR